MIPAKTAPAAPKTAKQWIADISAEHRQGVDCFKQGSKHFIEIGRMLIAAKEALPRQFQKMIGRDLPFGARTAQMLMAIAGDPRLTDANHGSLWEIGWRTLYELHQLNDPDFAEARRLLDINPSATRQDIKRVKAKVTQEGPAFTAPATKAVTQGETVVIIPRAVSAEPEPVADVAPLGLKNLAKAADAYVAAIASAIEQGERPDLIAGCDETLRRRVRELLANLPARTH